MGAIRSDIEGRGAGPLEEDRVRPIGGAGH